METHPSQHTTILLMMFCFPPGVKGYAGFWESETSGGRKYDIRCSEYESMRLWEYTSHGNPTYIRVLSVTDYQSSDTPVTEGTTCWYELRAVMYMSCSKVARIATIQTLYLSVLSFMKNAILDTIEGLFVSSLYMYEVLWNLRITDVKLRVSFLKLLESLYKVYIHSIPCAW